MLICLPQHSSEETPLLDERTAREIVAELDKYVIGQADAKKAGAIALRNRVRRQKLDPEMAEEVMPKNILMIGPTGVGKTEIARRLAKLANSPFLKVEASKFTEVGYVGRDVESIIRDLVDVSTDMVREERLDQVAERAEQNAEDRLLDLLMPPAPEQSESQDRTRDKLREKLRSGKLDDRMVEVDVKERGPTFEVSTNGNIEETDINLKDVIPGLFGGRTRKRNMRVQEALEYLIQEEEQKLVDIDQVTRIALERVERNGIVFLDEIDKIAGREGGHGPDVSREGVQRDLLPLIEGTTVGTAHVLVTDDMTRETFYVAATRARDWLILSAGAGPSEKAKSPAMALLDERFDRRSGLCRALGRFDHLLDHHYPTLTCFGGSPALAVSGLGHARGTAATVTLSDVRPHLVQCAAVPPTGRRRRTSCWASCSRPARWTDASWRSCSGASAARATTTSTTSSRAIFPRCTGRSARISRRATRRSRPSGWSRRRTSTTRTASRS